MGQHIDLNALQIFAKVAENRSFTKAAKELSMEKSTVSSKISELEKRLGLRLLNRNTRHVALTEIGKDYYNYCRSIADKALEADQFIKTLDDEPQGVLRLSAPTGIGRILFNDLFDVFLKKYPKIKLDVNLTMQTVDLVREGYDVSIRASDAGSLQDSSLVAKKLFDVDLGFFATKEYVESNDPIETIEALEKHPLIQTYQRQITLMKDNKKYVPDLKPRIVINYLDACIAALYKNLGIGLLPVSSVTADLEKKSIVQVLPEYTISPASLYIMYPSRQFMPAKVKVFIDFMDEWRKDYQMV